MDRLLTRRAPRSREVAAQVALFGRTSTLMMMFALLLVLATAMVAMAQDKGGAYEPQVGQAGKDVVWVPTPQSLVDKMLEMAKATPKDYLIDLGSGDGRTVITAAKLGLRAHGI